jgi:hypothetical protein
MDKIKKSLNKHFGPNGQQQGEQQKQNKLDKDGRSSVPSTSNEEFEVGLATSLRLDFLSFLFCLVDNNVISSELSNVSNVLSEVRLGKKHVIPTSVTPITRTHNILTSHNPNP